VTTEGIPRDNGGLRAAVVLPMFRGKRMWATHGRTRRTGRTAVRSAPPRCYNDIVIEPMRDYAARASDHR